MKRGILPSQIKSRLGLFGGKRAICRGSGPDWRAGAGARVWSPLPPGQVKSSCYSPKFIEQTAHCDHKPRAAWVYGGVGVCAVVAPPASGCRLG